MLTPADLEQEILIPTDQLQARVAALGAAISQDYAPVCERGESLLLICILRGAVIFLGDLIRHITVPHRVDFMAFSSYGVGARASSGNVRVNYDSQQNIAKQHVVVVEDIVDSGYTIAAVLNLLASRHPASLKVCALLDKFERRAIPVPLDYVGFQIPDKYVFGYGLDVDELFRNVPYIGVVKPGWKLEG